MKRNEIIVIGMLGFLLISSIGGIGLQLGTMGYSSGFQNPRAEFAGIRYKGITYTAADKKTAAFATFGTTLSFDPDAYNDGMVNLEGEQTTVFVPEESLGGAASWIPTEWLQRNAVYKNPVESYAWNISGKTYKMEQWTLKYYVSFSGEYDGGEETVHYGAGHPEDIGRSDRVYYQDTEVWIEFDLTPTWYIEGGGRAYFAVASAKLSDVKKAAFDNNGKEETASTRLSFAPESGGDPLYIYYGLFGTEAPKSDPYTYKGKTLNPKLFRDTVYAKIRLNNFGVDFWNEWTTLKTKGDAIALGFDISVFVIGEWDVKDIDTIDWEDWGRTAKTDENPSLLDYLSDPRVQMLLTAAAGLALLIFIIIFAPSVLIVILSLFGGGRRRR